MNTKHAGNSKQSMTRRLSRLAAGGALVAAALTTVAPAMAYQPRDPSPHGSYVAPTDPPVPSQPPASAEVSDSVDLSSAGLGVLAGIALGGAGLGISLGIQRRRDRSA
ncbi:hypothetical protein ACFWUU_35745 [Kribbella sp. NPDC058693]|uniref:Uncharacterized protein n=1 Tax=Kribbella jiaozuonensis TaxID=2575441 RepID=A0A4U3LHD1_9ACTN|nr:hypothetical protein [Kribbella jiaozuonensis]TKK73467.1 hypothetical protein FDA38_39860 [Kribbella jiaozuonensis]